MELTAATILSLLLALTCLATGAMKFSGHRVARETPPHLGIGVGLYRLAGILELLTAAGLVLAAIGVIPAWIGAAAGFGVALLMVFAIRFHLRVGDPLIPRGPLDPAWGPTAVVLALGVLTGILILR